MCDSPHKPRRKRCGAGGTTKTAARYPKDLFRLVVGESSTSALGVSRFGQHLLCCDVVSLQSLYYMYIRTATVKTAIQSRRWQHRVTHPPKIDGVCLMKSLEPLVGPLVVVCLKPIESSVALSAAATTASV